MRIFDGRIIENSCARGELLLKKNIVQFLAARNMIGYWHHCHLSVCLSVCDAVHRSAQLRVGVGG